MLRVNEIFHSIQGESTHAGRPCVFVRLTGCNLRCTWCDTEYAFHEGTPMSVDEVVRQVEAFGCRLVEVTGGEPLIQADAPRLLAALREAGHDVLVETGGHMPIATVPEGVRRIVDLKCPGSGASDRNRWDNLAELRDGDEIKFVIRDRADFEWAVDVVAEHRLAERVPVLFSPVHGELAPEDLAAWILDRGVAARLQLQVHKVLWPERVRGV